MAHPRWDYKRKTDTLEEQLKQERALSDRLAGVLSQLQYDVRDKQKAQWFEEYDEALDEYRGMR